MCVFVFFKQKTAYEMRISDWSSDVCSSDLDDLATFTNGENAATVGFPGVEGDVALGQAVGDVIDTGDVSGKAVAKAAGTVILAKLTRGKIHGNSRASPKPQIRYVIRDGNGDAVKTGISGKQLNKDGTHGLANTQIKAMTMAEGPTPCTAEGAET